MKSPSVSIIIPTYRHRDFILRTLDSVFAQTMHDYEIIVINDGSPDDTKSVLSPLIASKRIRYFEQANQGQSRTRNRGVNIARGKYIAFLDDDDLWPKDKLEWQLAFLEDNQNVSLISGVLQAIDGQDCLIWKGHYKPTITFESLFQENPFLSPGQTLIRTDTFKAVGGMNTAIWGADDWDLWFRLAKKSKIVMQDRLALYYRIHAGNASNQTARLLKAACQTIELHLPDIQRSKRRWLRTVAHRNLYNGLGKLLVTLAKTQLRQGKLFQAIESLAGLTPLRQGIFLDKQLRAHFFSELGSPITRRFFRK